MFYKYTHVWRGQNRLGRGVCALRRAQKDRAAGVIIMRFLGVFSRDELDVNSPSAFCFVHYA